MERQVSFEVKGMHCPDCPGKVERNLAKMEGVKTIKVDYENQTGYVTYDETQLSLHTIFDRVSEMGFEAHEMQEK